MDLTLKIQDMAEATDIYEIEAPSFDTAWRAPAAADSYVPATAKMHILQPIPPSVLSTGYSAADHRSITILSYFHAIFSHSPPNELEQVTATRWNTLLPLCAHLPYEIDCTKAFEQIILTGAGAEDVVPSEVGRVLNGAIVGLVTCEPGTLDNAIDTTPTSADYCLPYSQGFSAPSPFTSMCHGLALIRSMSPNLPQMHVLTPLPHHLLAKSRVLVKGEMELPIWGMLDFRNEDGVAGVEKGKVPYLQWGKGEGIGTERRKIRRNLMRRSQV